MEPLGHNVLKRQPVDMKWNVHTENKQWCEYLQKFIHHEYKLQQTILMKLYRSYHNSIISTSYTYCKTISGTQCYGWTTANGTHDDVIKWKHFPRYWPFVRGIHRWPVNSPHKGQWHRALMFSLICAWINSWVNNRDVGYLRCHSAHYDVTVMQVTIR